MSEYTYFQGSIKPITTKFSQCYEILSNSDFLNGLENPLIKKDEYIVIDTITKKSADLTSRDSFISALRGCLPFLAETAELEYFRWGEGYFKVKMAPNSKDIVLTKIRDFDPNGQNITQEELFTYIKGTNSKEVIKQFHDLIKQMLATGKTVQTDVGLFYSMNKKSPAREVRNPQSGERVSIRGKTIKTISLKGNDL